LLPSTAFESATEAKQVANSERQEAIY